MNPTLTQLKELGVKTLQVKNNEATAVNPYHDYTHLCVCTDDRMCDNHNLYYEVINLLPLPTSGIPDGTVKIEEVEEQEQYESKIDEDTWYPIDEKTDSSKAEIVAKKYILRIAIVPKQMKEEAKVGRNYFPDIKIDGYATIMPCKDEIVSPANTKGEVTFGFTEPQEQAAEGILAKHLGEDYEDMKWRIISDHILNAMQAYADQQLAQYKAKLIAIFKSKQDEADLRSEEIGNSDRDKSFSEYGISMGFKRAIAHVENS